MVDTGSASRKTFADSFVARGFLQGDGDYSTGYHGEMRGVRLMRV